MVILKELPMKNPLELIRMGGLLKIETILPLTGRTHMYADLAYSAMELSALKFRRGKKEEAKEWMDKALKYLKVGERYHPWEKVREGEPVQQWSSKLRDSWRFGIEIYNALAKEYQRQEIKITSLEIQEGRLISILTTEERIRLSLDSSML